MEEQCPSNKRLRSPICVFEGHVDHGKSSLLDRIMGSSITKTEAGQITQSINAYLIPIENIKSICEPILCKSKINFNLPGILFIDTPGHSAFVSLRKRGGSIADFAVVVVDVNEGFMPQTEEVIGILKANKTPFIVAANKIDMVPGWEPMPKELLIQNISKQGSETQALLDQRIYTIVERLYAMGFASERFDRVEDFTRQIAIVPVSAKTGEGIPELLSLIVGLVQRYLSSGLHCTAEGNAKGSILEVKEEPGLGSTVEAVIYDGTLRKGDFIVVGGVERPISAKVRAIFEKKAPTRKDKRYELVQVEEAVAATSVCLKCSETEGMLAGMPFLGCRKENEISIVSDEVQGDIKKIFIETEEEGIIVKAANLGALEAVVTLFKNSGIKIRKVGLGAITKSDVIDAEASLEREPLNAVIVAFESSPNKEAKEYLNSSKVKIITSNIIYNLLDEFERWRDARKEELERAALSSITSPCKIQILPNFIFRKSNPAIVGVEVLLGTLKPETPLMKDGKKVTVVKTIQEENQSIPAAVKGKQVAVSLEGVTIGRQLNPGDVLYSFMPESDFVKIKNYKEYLREDEVEALREIALEMRKENKLWGV
ncbi:MAG: translation initiation factor IF-2 [Candidatus Woesearchaeota archaeon]